jgi:Skp family chaperone for outer membrane proteins
MALMLQLPTPAGQDVTAPGRILNVPRLLAESIDGKAATAALDAFQAERKKALAEKQAAIEKLAAARAAAAEIARARLDLQRAAQDAETDFAALAKEVQADFDRQLRPVLKEMVEEKQIGIIFEYPQGMILWTAPAADITDEVIARLDAAAAAATKKK